MALDDLANVVHPNPSVEDVPDVKEASRSPEDKDQKTKKFSILATPLPVNEGVLAPEDHQESESLAEDVKEPSKSPEDDEHQRIKKPLNAFMCFAKEHRPKLCTEPGTPSAENNKILGKKWQELSPEERKKYFDKAEKEHEEHKIKYPEWSPAQNYRRAKTKKRTRKMIDEKQKPGKKYRAHFGMENRKLWCRKCLLKQRCSYQESSTPSESDANEKMGIQNPKPMILNI
ncbi:hypothetical protein L3Y34_011434 [Caenorhabditis briggsae]|uniref:HMG box domain-containing protein n=1 Tax=Caenorhabditis briggsae TaxID=6238 RepID=A0AAE8ZPX0_CAEBR|nr:hypothetical protein L3Y34_011434 [Caenorhabditis briggsae]